MRTKKPMITRAWLRSLQLGQAERLKLAMFVGNHRNWRLRHAIAVEDVVRHCLQEQWLDLRRMEKVEGHPICELALRLGRSSPRTKTGVEKVVRLAFRCAWPVG